MSWLALWRHVNPSAPVLQDSGSPDRWRKALLAEIYAELIPLGFHKKGKIFWKDAGESYWRVDLQYGPANSRHDASFCVNLALIFKAGEEQVDVRKLHTYFGHWHKRLSQGANSDDWWRIHSNAECSAAASEIRKLLRELAIPTFEEIDSAEKVRRFYPPESKPWSLLGGWCSKGLYKACGFPFSA